MKERPWPPAAQASGARGFHLEEKILPMPIYPKEYLENNHGPAVLNSCFVLMPFGRQFDEVHHAIRSACEAPDLLLSCSRADDFYGAGHIMEDILKGIVHSEYIVADVSGKNPNVFYELGIAHCCKPPSKVIILSQTMDDVPFDLRHLRCILYRADPPGLRKLDHDLVRAFQSDSEGVHRFAIQDNGTHDFTERLSGRGRNFYTFRITEIWVGSNDLKLTIWVQRQSLDQGPAEFGPSHHYMQLGESVDIQQTKWVLRVDRIENRRAFFSVLPKEAVA
jgi:hypothetical protein